MQVQEKKSGGNLRNYRRNGNVIFSVYGLEDTIADRQNVLMEQRRAMKSFIEAGGRARWDFLVFDFNEHPVDEARKLSEEWGFEKSQ